MKKGGENAHRRAQTATQMGVLPKQQRRKQAGFSKAKKATESGNEKDKTEWQGNEKGMGNEKEPEQGNRKEVRNQNPRKGNKKALRRHQEDWMER